MLFSIYDHFISYLLSEEKIIAFAQIVIICLPHMYLDKS